MIIRRALTSVILVGCCIASCLVTVFAAGSITITCGSGGTVANITGNVSIKDGVIFIDGDGLASFDIVTDEGFQIDSVAMNGRPMGSGYTGEGPKTVTLSPNGADIQIEVMFRNSSTVIPGSELATPSDEPEQMPASSTTPTPSGSKPSDSESGEDIAEDPTAESEIQTALPAASGTPTGSAGKDGVGNISENIVETPRDWSKLGPHVSIVIAAFGSAAVVVYFVRKRS